jgi:hypothetical protein
MRGTGPYSRPSAASSNSPIRILRSACSVCRSVQHATYSMTLAPCNSGAVHSRISSVWDWQLPTMSVARPQGQGKGSAIVPEIGNLVTCKVLCRSIAQLAPMHKALSCRSSDYLVQVMRVEARQAKVQIVCVGQKARLAPVTPAIPLARALRHGAVQHVVV